ncbi:hypothetical protein [uncultured Ruminococcus sp.]|uniref:hypothetical protein n=1 Tax=uncultured Ruminococcus sp. TaxID=165186 RepID=UPI0025DD2E7B|nr:hypothetical protein [uncultured Ruminococcus sp.]
MNKDNIIKSIVYSGKYWEKYGEDTVDIVDPFAVVYSMKDTQEIFFIQEYNDKPVSIIPTDTVFKEMVDEINKGIWYSTGISIVPIEDIDVDAIFSGLMEDEEMRKHKEELERGFKWARGEIEAPDLDAEEAERRKREEASWVDEEGYGICYED